MSLDIVMGPMFAGKSSHILQIISRHAAIGTSVYVIKHGYDTRYAYSEENIVTHDGRLARCVTTTNLFHPTVLAMIKDIKVIIVDEAQFFHDLVAFVHQVVEIMGKQLYLVGLDGDSNRQPFGDILQCIPLADRIHKLTAFCKVCADGTPALFTKRLSGVSDQQVIVGGKEIYTSVCRPCYLRQSLEDPRA